MRAYGDVPPAARAVLVVATTSLFMVLVAWATLIGPDEVFTGPGPQAATITASAESCVPLPVTTHPDGSTTVEVPDDAGERDYCEPPDTTAQDARRMVEQSDVPLWVKLVVWTLELLLLLVLFALLAALVVRIVRALAMRRRRRGPPDDADFAVLDEPGRVAAQVVADAAEQDALLREGGPRNAIVAAWHRFEVQGERAGVPRRGWETSSEYALRILELVEADTGAVNRLAGLYREARFSTHDITEGHRSEALAALEAIRHSVVVRP